MALDISPEMFKSLDIRKQVAGGDLTRLLEFGLSILDADPDSPDGGTGENQGFLQWIVGGIKNAIGWIGRAAVNLVKGAFKLAWTLITGAVFQVIDFIFTFDWNASDAEIDEMIKNHRTQIFANIGGFLGRLGGSLVCITIWGAAMTFMPMIGSKAIATAALSGALPELLAELGEDAWDRLKQVVMSAGRIQSLIAYKTLRKKIKTLPNDLLVKFGISADKVAKFKEKWGAPDGDEWSFQKAQNDKVEAIKDPGWQAFTEEFLEEFRDGCQEAAFIIADRGDQARSDLDKIEERLQGKNAAVFVYPDKNNKAEKYLYYGKEKNLEIQILSDINKFQYFRNRDIGFFEESNEVMPTTFWQERRLKVLIFSSESRPWRKTEDNPNFVKWTCQIPYPRKDLTFDDVRRCFSNAQYSGHYATGTGRKGRIFFAHGGSKDGAVEQLRELEKISEDWILDDTIRLHEKRAVRYTGRLYFGYFHATVCRETTDNKGRKTRDGKTIISDSIRIEATQGTFMGSKSIFDLSLYGIKEED